MMCEETEIKLVADTGTLFIGLKEGRVWLGLSEDNDPEGNPEVRIFLTDRQTKVAVSELSMLADEVEELFKEEGVEEEE